MKKYKHNKITLSQIPSLEGIPRIYTIACTSLKLKRGGKKPRCNIIKNNKLLNKIYK